METETNKPVLSERTPEKRNEIELNIPEGFQLVKVDDLKKLIAITKQIKQANLQFEADATAMVDSFTQIMNLMGLDEVLLKKKKISTMSMVSRFMKIAPSVMKGTNPEISKAAKQFIHFLKTYSTDKTLFHDGTAAKQLNS